MFEIAKILERNRAQLVRKYRANPAPWPDGIDAKDPAKGEQWYRGHEGEWTEERIERALGWPENESMRPVVRTTAQALEALSNRVSNKSNSQSNKSDVELKFDKAAYQREYMRRRRAKRDGQS